MKGLIILMFAAMLLGNFVSAQEERCVPQYECTDWSECKDGLSTRTCEDLACGSKTITERSFCQKPRCIPNIVCGEWSNCDYTSKTENILNAEIKFHGSRWAVCWDTNGCIPKFIQTESCVDTNKLLLSPSVVCGVTYLVAKDLSSGRDIAQINFNNWITEGRFDLAFIQGKPEYCPSCYNGILDENEEDIDCGGNCKPCKPDRKFFLYSTIIFLWTGSFVFILFSFRQYLSIKKAEQLTQP